MVKVILVGDSELTLPVTPEEIKVDSGQVINKFYNYWSGYRVKQGHIKPKTLSVASFFPKNTQDFVISDILGLDCVKIIESWRKSKKNIRVIIAELSIDGEFCIESFQYTYTRSGDISYSLSMIEAL